MIVNQIHFQTKIQSRLNDSYPITSISFHAKEPLIFYSIDNRIVIWNYEIDTKITDLFAMEESRIKYVLLGWHAMVHPFTHKIYAFMLQICEIQSHQ